MKVFVFNETEEEDRLDYPDEVARIRRYMEEKGIFPLPITNKRLEILWYAFSDTYDATFLIPDEHYFLPVFTQWLSELEYEDAIHMDEYGNIEEEDK